MSKSAVPLLILTLLTIASIVTFTLIQTAFKSTVPKATQQQLEPLDPEIDLTLIEELEKSVK